VPGRDLLGALLEATKSGDEPFTEVRALPCTKLRLLVRIRRGRPQDEVLDEAMTFVLAGHETTATLLSWWLYAVGNHPAVMAKCVEEIDALGGEEPSTQQLKELTYLDATIKETLVSGYRLLRRSLTRVTRRDCTRPFRSSSERRWKIT
jgi:cytochrome P450